MTLSPPCHLSTRLELDSISIDLLVKPPPLFASFAAAAVDKSRERKRIVLNVRGITFKLRRTLVLHVGFL